jgi:hypothetical protein
LSVFIDVFIARCRWQTAVIFKVWVADAEQLSMHLRHRLFTALSFTLLSLSTLGCGGDPAVVDSQRAGCAQLLHGKSYSICGQLSTTPMQVASADHQLQSSLNANVSGQGTQYAVRGGSFHVSH